MPGRQALSRVVRWQQHVSQLKDNILDNYFSTGSIRDQCCPLQANCARCVKLRLGLILAALAIVLRISLAINVVVADLPCTQALAVVAGAVFAITVGVCIRVDRYQQTWQ